MYPVCAQNLHLYDMCVTRNDKRVQGRPKVRMSELLHASCHDLLRVCAQPCNSHTKGVWPVGTFPTALLYLQQLLYRCVHCHVAGRFIHLQRFSHIKTV